MPKPTKYTLRKVTDIELLADLRTGLLTDESRNLALDEIQRRLHDLRLRDIERSYIQAAPHLIGDDE